MGFGMFGSCCCGVSSNAYHLGGLDATASTFYNIADRTVFSTDVTSAVSGANLSGNRAEVQGVSNPAVAGYACGGRTSAAGAITTGDKLTFSSETTAAATTANLSTARYAGAGISERSTKGYFAGGFALTTVADKITFSSDTTGAQTSANLSVSRGGVRGLTEGTTKGYFGGGFTAASSWTVVSDMITFSTDTTAAQASANLSIARDRYHSFSDGSTKGFFAAGQTGSASTRIDRITFSTDTLAAVTTSTMTRVNGSSNSDGTKGYAGGGATTLVGSNVDSMNLSTEAVSTLSAASNLSTARTGVVGLSTVAL
jgi:hypothetical protein